MSHSLTNHTDAQRYGLATGTAPGPASPDRLPTVQVSSCERRSALSKCTKRSTSTWEEKR